MSNNKNLSIVIFAYGFMGKYSLEGLEKNKNFSIKGVIVPKSDQFYYSNVKLKKKIIKSRY